MAVQTALMASNTRSNRRAARHATTTEGPKGKAVDAPPPNLKTVTRDAQHGADHEATTIPVGRKKRTLSTADRDRDADVVEGPTKRQKTDVDVAPPRHKNSLRSLPTNATRTATQAPPPTSTTPSKPDHQQSTQVSQHDPPPQAIEGKPSAKAKTASNASHVPRGRGAGTGAGSGAPPTKHQASVKAAIKHELDRLQPSDADIKEKPGGRKLRSQEATRFKSELSAYFPDYDEVIGNDPKEQRT